MVECKSFVEFANTVTANASVYEQMYNVNQIKITIGDVSTFIPINETSIGLVLEGIERAIEQGVEETK